MKRLFCLLAAVTCLLCLCGCVATDVTGPNGTRLRRISVFGDQSASKVDLGAGTMEGYKSEQAQASAAVVGAAVEAALKAPRP